ncbi:protease FtsH subunit HflC [Limimonas halophila]|uniref:Protein HflC n=1 Tax=Limimonas halophila TaxID=1082479 RepID=A0A1G7PWS2_9PROT|nr:protease modulator HflC [Limimonas halophila]SDF90716.1 protease FtsH subunit HflC [Limimonas halophila]
MTSKKVISLGVLAVALIIVASSALFTVHQTQQAIVLQFGDPRNVIREPGLHVKVPFVQEVVTYEKRLIDLDPPVERVLLANQKPLDVDSFARYRIDNPLQFFQTVRVEENLRARLGSIINSSLRSVLGSVDLASLLSNERAAIMERISKQVNKEAERFGINVVDVRIGRTDLPEQVQEAVYSRMRSERQQEAAQIRARGQERAREIRANAERQATVIKAEAQRESEILRGEAEATRTRTLSKAYGQAPEFFNFYRSLQAYEKSINQDGSDNSYLVLSTERNAFFRLFNQGAITDALGVEPGDIPDAPSQDGQVSGREGGETATSSVFGG